MQILCVLLAPVLLFIYISSACPAIYLGDAGELVTSALTMGIGHPPGYPLYMLVNKIMMLAPAGDFGFRVNAGTAALAVLSLLLFFSLSRMFSGKTTAALAVTITLALSAPFFRQAAEAKGGVYILMYLAAFAALYCVFKFSETKNLKWFYCGMYAAGFMPLLHHASAAAVLFISSILYYTAVRRRAKAGTLAVAALFFILSLVTSSFYLFIREAGNPEIKWAGIDGFAAVVKHMLRYPYVALDDPPLTLASFLYKTGFYLKAFFVDYHLAAVASVIGFFLLYREKRKAFQLLAGYFVLNSLIVIAATGNDIYLYGYVNRGFYLLSDMAALLAAAYALARLQEYFRSGFTAAVSVVVLSVLIFSMGWRGMSASEKFSGYDYPRNLLAMLGKGDILLTGDDRSVFTLQYADAVKRSANGVTLYDRNANMLDLSFYSEFKPGVRLPAGALDNKEKNLCLSNPGRVYYSDGKAFPDVKLRTFPFGIVYRMMPADSAVRGYEQPLSLCMNRDYFRNKNLDHFYSEQAGLYFVALAEHAAVKRNMQRFDFFRHRAEETGAGVAVVLRRIASVYFHEFLDVRNTLAYLEKAYALEPMNFRTLDLIIALYRETGQYAKAVEWLRVYADREWRRQSRDAIRKEIGFLSSKF